MFFSLFFSIGSVLMLVSVLFVIQRRDRALRGFSIAVSLTTVTLLAGALLRLTDPAARAAQLRLLSDVVTVATLSACAILLIAWTVRLWRAAS
jgi:hypothetical protein